ncbi:hypothetical protein [Nonomuraea basaltis]|uniref:hypothetical protein n=1 Tax=Nonomuraea basaltis TaxID=2495887 RepID=UPI001486B832|nr:hypothetical protein [Nonomuraea basaltis]
MITGLAPMFLDAPRWGAEPDRLLQDLEDLGLANEFDEDDKESSPEGSSLSASTT